MIWNPGMQLGSWEDKDQVKVLDNSEYSWNGIEFSRQTQIFLSLCICNPMVYTFKFLDLDY